MPISKVDNTSSYSSFVFTDPHLYITVAFKRFVDNIPMGVDRTLVRGVTVGLEGALFSGLAINGPGAYEKCKMLLSEPEDIAERRSELHKRQQRLLSAKEELIDVFV